MNKQELQREEQMFNNIKEICEEYEVEDTVDKLLISKILEIIEGDKNE